MSSLAKDVSVARGLLDREGLLQMLDRAVSSKRVTVISAPPGSGKTSLLRAWADRSTDVRRVAFVSVDRDHRDPPIRLHRLRLGDEVAEIRAGDLRFTDSETRELLSASEISLSDAGVAALYQRTEGWAAGLRLAVISLGGHPDPERFVDEFSGTDRAIAEYLMAEMLERQPSEVQSMLLRTSLVDQINGGLADLLAGRSGCEQMLLELE